jgi:hypothetical protein
VTTPRGVELDNLAGRVSIRVIESGRCLTQRSTMACVEKWTAAYRSIVRLSDERIVGFRIQLKNRRVFGIHGMHTWN